MSEIKPANERLSDYLKTLSPRLNQFAIAHIAETVLPQFQIEEAIELRAAYEALQKENAELRDRITIMDEAAKYYNETIIGISNKLHAQNEALKLKKEFIEYAAQDLENQNEAQAKRIAELEEKDEMLGDMLDLLKIDKENWFSLYSVVAELKSKNGDSK